MEENNNIFSQNESDGEKIVSDDTQVQNEAVSEDGADVIDDAALQDSENREASEDGYVSQFSDIIGVTDEQAVATAVKVKKKRFVMPCIIISACVMLVSVLIGVAFLFFFNTSVTGAYVIEGSEQEDTATTYFFFEDNGKLRQCIGTVEIEGTYETTTEDSVSKITLEIPASYVNVTYNYKLDGNKLTGMKMLLSDDNGNSITFVPATYDAPKLEPIDKAQLDSKLVGKWEDSAGYGLVYTFNDDYSFVMSGNGMNINGYYSAENKTVKIKYY
ncbi:MAG: hypothetical protein ACI4RP_02940, partial [Acutalibacteraceae bacterium]